VAQSSGFSYQEGVSRWPHLPGRPVSVGGVTVTCAQAAAALGALRASGGIMVRQVLAAAASPLAACDYHAAALPFIPAVRAEEQAPACSGRGAAGRPVTKTAFMRAVSAALAAAGRAEPARHFAGDLEQAMAAFSSDSGYAAAMARAAVAVAGREHAAALRAQASQAVHQAVSACDARRGQFACAAVSACGTGDCRLAAGPLAAPAMAVPAPPGRLPRPANHARAGTGFGIAAALAALEAAVPFDVTAAARTVRVPGADRATAADAAA
jgi:hypothetical protein